MGVVIGAFVMGVMNNGMSILGIGIYWQQVVKGLVLLGAVCLTSTTSGADTIGQREPSVRRQLVVFLARRKQQRRGMDHPIHARFLPGLPAIRKPLLDKHAMNPIERKRRFACYFPGVGIMGEECEEKTELSGRTDQIVLSISFVSFCSNSPGLSLASELEPNSFEVRALEMAPTTPARSRASNSATFALATFEFGSRFRFCAMNLPTSDRFRQSSVASVASRSKSASLSRPEPNVVGSPCRMPLCPG